VNGFSNMERMLWRQPSTACQQLQLSTAWRRHVAPKPGANKYLLRTQTINIASLNVKIFIRSYILTATFNSWLKETLSK